MMMSQSPQRGGDTTTIAVLSWALAAIAVEPTTTPAARWLAVHPADASLAARLAGQLGNRVPAPCRF
jgi:hypothetical protein